MLRRRVASAGVRAWTEPGARCGRYPEAVTDGTPQSVAVQPWRPLGTETYQRRYELFFLAALLAVVTLGLSAVALPRYVGGAGEIFGPVNDALPAATFALLAPVVEAVRQPARGAAGRWFGVASGAALAGIAAAVVGQVLLIAGLLPLACSFVTLGVGGLLIVGWTEALVVIALRHGVGGASGGLVGRRAHRGDGRRGGRHAAGGTRDGRLSVVFGIPILVLELYERDIARQIPVVLLEPVTAS